MKKRKQGFTGLFLTPPDELDSAKVIKWEWSGNEPFGHLSLVGSDSANDSIEILGLAICQYDASDSVYRFSCDKNREIQQDDGSVVKCILAI
jgi:hypothetical protein